MAGKRAILAGAVAGAVVVALLAVGLGELVRDLAHPAVVIAFLLLGAVLGAYAAGVVAYERVRKLDEPSAAYRDGILAEPDPN
jgi:hypothetical protein